MVIDKINKEKHSGLETVFLHTFPGILNITVMVLFLPLTKYFNLLPFTANYFMIIIIMVPFQIGYLFYIAKTKTGVYDIMNIIVFKNNSKLIEYIVFIIIITAWAILIIQIFSPIEIYIRDNLFVFIPDNIALRNTDLTVFPKNGLLFTCILGILTNGILAPISEEMYFRGYLLPRINLSSKWSVVVNASLFSLYHFFSPWQFFSRLLMVIPIYIWTVKKQDIKFALIAHIIGNLYSSIGLLIAVLAL